MICLDTEINHFSYELIGGWAVYHSLFNGLFLCSIRMMSLTFLVDGGHRAVKFSRIGGVKDQIYGEGTHFMIPW